MLVFSDVRYSLRTLAKSPGFAIVAILSLALGVGANTAMFSFVDAILLRPLPVPHAGRIVDVSTTTATTQFGSVAYPDYLDLRDQTKTLQALTCYSLTPMGYTANRDAVPKIALGAIVSWNFFSGLGVDVPIGRSFRPDEDQTPGRDLVAVISHALWENDFASDPNIVGRKVRVNGYDFTVIGVATASFSGPEAYIQPPVYLPVNAFPQAIPGSSSTFLADRADRQMTVYGRLKPGVTASEAHAELNTIAGRLAAQYPETNRGRRITVSNYRDARFQRNPVDGTLAYTLLGITGLVLLIACANVANLVLARGTGRVKEIAIRMAVGASRASLIRQLLTESLLLAIAGGAAGFAVAYGAIQYLNSIPMPADFPISFDVRMDTRLLIFGFTVAIATGIVFGLAPALRSTRADLSNTIKSSDQGPGRGGFLRGRFSMRNILVTAQLTLSVVLLILSSYFVQGFRSARHMDVGLRIDHTAFFSLDPKLARYDEARTRQFYRNLKNRLRALNGVEEVSLSSSLPFNANQQNRAIMPGDGPPVRNKELPMAWSNIVDENFFPLMETRILRGRGFDARDAESSPRVAVVNETLAKRLWPNQDAVGQRIRLDKPDAPPFQVIGVAKDGKYLYWTEPSQAVVWTANTQEYSSHMVVAVRTRDDPAAIIPALRREVHALDADMPVVNVNTMESFFKDRITFPPRLIAQTVTAIGLMGLLLAVIGLYGVVSYAVSRRTREIGIRMAIGARPFDVLRMVLGQGMIFTAIGIVVGGAIAVSASGLLKDFVLGARITEPGTLIGIPLLLAVVMMVACWIPARRASSVDPTRALRQE